MLQSMGCQRIRQNQVTELKLLGSDRFFHFMDSSIVLLQCF